MSGVKSPHPIPFSIALDGLLLVKILQNGTKFMQKMTPVFKNRVRNLDNFRQTMESLKR